MRKFLAIFLVVVMVLSMSACGKKRDEVIYPDQDWQIATPAYDEKVDITMWFPNSATSPIAEILNGLVAKFNAEQKADHGDKGINVTIEFQGFNSALNTKLQAAILANDNPVIVGNGFSTTPLYTDKAVDLRTVYSYDELELLNEGLLQYSMINNKFVTAPYFPSASNILVVNKTLFDKAGIEIPNVEDILKNPEKSDWTWDKFKSVTSQLTKVDSSNDDNSIYGFAAGSLDPVGMMYQQGTKLYNDTVTGLTEGCEEAAVKGLEFWRSLVTDGSMRNPNSRAKHASIIASEFMTGNVGMIYTTSSNMAKFTNAGAEAGFEVAVLPFPKNTEFFVNQGGSGIIILNNRPQEEIDAAAEFLRWLSKPENNAEMCAKSGYIPMVTASLEEQTMLDIYADVPTLKSCAEIMQFGVRAPQGKAKGAVDSKVNGYGKQIWSEIDKPIADIVKEMLAEAQYEIDANS